MPDDHTRGPWSVHDGKFFASAIKEVRPRAPNERRLGRETDQLQAWVDACGDFPPPNETIMPEAGTFGKSYDTDAMHSICSHPFDGTMPGVGGSRNWSVHDGQFFLC